MRNDLSKSRNHHPELETGGEDEMVMGEAWWVKGEE